MDEEEAEHLSDAHRHNSSFIHRSIVMDASHVARDASHETGTEHEYGKRLMFSVARWHSNAVADARRRRQHRLLIVQCASVH